MPPTTRRATVVELEQKLKTALVELKKSKLLCDQLLKERDDGEAELLNINGKIKELKKELSELHTQYKDVCSERDQVQEQLCAVGLYSDYYVQALDQIRHLELQLNESLRTIEKFEEEKERCQCEQTLCLYDELVDKNLKVNNVISINGGYFSNRKYIKLLKFIKKYKNKLNNNFIRSRNISLKSDCRRLMLEAKQNSDYILNLQQQYNSDNLKSKTEINNLHLCLTDLTEKYQLSQNDLAEQIKNMDEILQLSKYNADRFDSFVNKNCCSCENQANLSEPGSSLSYSSVTPSRDITNNTLLLTDSIGTGIGQYFNYNLDHSVTNYCMPGNSFKNIVKSISSKFYNSYSNIVIMVGNGLNTSKKDLLDSVDLLSEIGVRNVTICTFLYSNQYSTSQNKHIYYLNNCMYNLTCYNNLFTLFDINKFVKNINMTQDSFKLPMKVQKSIATLVANNILLSIDSTSSFSTSTNNVVVQPILNL